jgi:hypothetical protein
VHEEKVVQHAHIPGQVFLSVLLHLLLSDGVDLVDGHISPGEFVVVLLRGLKVLPMR